MDNYCKRLQEVKKPETTGKTKSRIGRDLQS